MKNKIFAFLTFLCMICILGFVPGCGEIEEYDVVCTVFPQYDFCKQIAGDLKIKMILPPGTDAHNYELTAKDKAIIKKCKLFIYIGGESESWVNGIIKSSDLSKVSLLNLSSKVDLINIFDEDEKVERFDEHIWLSVSNAIKMTKAISDELVALYPDNEKRISENTVEYISKLFDLDTQYKDKLKDSARKKMYFADRFPFVYLTNEYGIEYTSLLGVCSTDMLISNAAKIEFEKEYTESGAIGVFVLEHSDQKLAESVIDRCGGKIYVLNSMQTITKKDLEEDVSYLQVMRSNLEEITEGLK